jgi:geranylgeranyl diphosphate synthase type II
MAAADAVGAEGEKFLTAACALEMIHTYSLVHDDLPAMDNDDYRRGRLTNHKVFGDGMAILAGDGLLTLAFETLLSQQEVDPSVLVRVTREIAAAAGPAGMVGGQAIDLEAPENGLSQETLRLMHRLKTGALFCASIRAGAMLAGASEKQIEQLTLFAEQFGLAFQITDDILDVKGDAEKMGKPVGSDEKNDKVTYVTLYTLPEAERMAMEAVQGALDAIADFGPGADILRGVTRYLTQRES